MRDHRDIKVFNNALPHFTLIASFAIHNLRSLRSVTRLKLIRAGFVLRMGGVVGGISIYPVVGGLTSASTSPVPQFEGVSLLETLIMPAVGAKTG